MISKSLEFNMQHKELSFTNRSTHFVAFHPRSTLIPANPTHYPLHKEASASYNWETHFTVLIRPGLYLYKHTLA